MKSKDPEYSQVNVSRFAIEMIQNVANTYYDIEKNAVKQGDNPTYWQITPFRKSLLMAAGQVSEKIPSGIY